MLKKSAISLAMFALVVTAAHAEDSPDQVVARHIAAFDKHDWTAIMLDYADDVVALLPDRPVVGKPALLAFFQSIDKRPSAVVFQVKQLKAEGDVGSTEWIANPGAPGAVKGRDVFIVRNGKIVFQGSVGVGPAAAP